MAYADVLFLDDCSDDSNEAFGQNIDQHVKDLVDPTKRKMAMHALSVHPYAADDLVNSPAWPTFCHSLTALLAESDVEVSTAAVDLADKVFREVRRSKPHELADLCLSLAAHVASGQVGGSLAACSSIHPASAQQCRDKASGDSSVQPVLPEVASCGASDSHTTRDGIVGREWPPSQTRGPKQAGMSAAKEDGQNRGERAAVRAAAVNLLLRCMQALPRMWATFRDPQLVQLWDALCPLLKLELCSPASSFVQQLSNGENAIAQHRMHLAAASPADCSGGPPISNEYHGPCAGVAVAQQRLAVTGAVAVPHPDWQLCGPLVEMCSAVGWSGDWWKAWTAPARPARWLPAALQRHHVLPSLMQACVRLRDSSERASTADIFAVQIVGSILALSLGRKLFPISIASHAVPSEPEQVTVEDAIMCLGSIATNPLRAEPPQLGRAWAASEVALDALHLLCRDDSPDFRILTQRNIAFLVSELETSKQSAGTDTYKLEVQRRLECMLRLLARTAYGRSMLYK
ncbi:g10303 [Coccomyxa elongata]